MISVRQVIAGYGGGTVLHGLDLEVESGEVFGVLGRNGMGKSTLIRVMAGLLTPREGSVWIGGEDLTRQPAHARAGKGIAVVPQGRGVFDELNVRENLELARMAAGKRARANRIAEVYRHFPRLEERPTQIAKTMSGGEQQMLAIARAEMMEPSVLLLDEPSDGLMPVLVDQIADTVRTISKSEGLTTVVVEQNVPMVMKMCDRVAVIDRGQVVATGTPDKLATTGEIERYLGV